MTECRRKTISSAAPPVLAHHTPTTRIPKSTSHPSPDSLFHLSDCPFGIPQSCSSIVGNSFLFGTAPKKKLSDSSFLFSPEKRAKRNPLHESTKPNLNLSTAAKMLSLEPYSSPSPSMKRSDVAILNLDQASLGSPVAKRPPKRQANSHHHAHPSSTHPTSQSTTTPLRRPPSRSMSGQPRPLNLLHQQVQAQHFEFSTPAPPTNKVSRRISVENFLRPPCRDSPFGLPAPMVDASVHLNPQPSHPKPHPLSFAESAFSTPSTTSTPRPQNPHVQNIVDTTQSQTFYTPQNYKLVKPLQAAFMSEGLLSKRNRSNSTGPLPSSLHMPDTPCKRPLSGTYGIFPIEPTTPLPGHLRHQISFFDTDSNSSQETPGRPSLSYKSDYEFPATPTKSVDNQGSTPSALWRVHNLGKSPGEEREVFSTGLEFPEMSPPKEHRRRSTTNGLLFQMPDLKGGRFGEKFEESEIMGTGEFSEVYEVVERDTGAKYAVKRTRFAMTGPKERQRRLEEVRTLRDLGHHEHILELIDSWEQYDHLFIQTELCENGSLDVFLRDYGNIERLDEFRVWKILTELTHGLQYIHDMNYIHLDIKPANVFITFEGTLKIGDFGMATTLPVPPDLEREGDREYIAPEILEFQNYDRPADIFSLGMTILETAANVCLPDNGLPWQKLRSGDLSDAPRLSSSDNNGDVMGDDMHVDGVIRPRGLEVGKLDDIVKWMLSPNPVDRPTCRQILASEEVKWVDSRRRAGAVIFEGEFGPDEDGHVEEKELEVEDWQMEL